ncbi:tyrosine protein kinase, partial [Parabacteroides sp. OttesenSCG-928-G21]|nr:tyrosine protein kinase [Parabacteroides sp. OttesenSCG-928-G21]
MENKDKESIGLKPIIIGYLLHWKLFLGVFIISLIPAVLYLVLYPKTYEMVARIQLQDETSIGSGSFGMGEAAGLMRTFGLNPTAGMGINMDDEIVLFGSASLLEKTVLELGLNVSYFKPGKYKYEMYDDVPVRLTPDSLTNANLRQMLTFKVKIAADEKVSVDMKLGKKNHKYTFNSLPAEIATDAGTFLLEFTEHKALPLNMKINVAPAKWAADWIYEELTIEEYSKTSYTIEFFYQDYEVNRGVDLLNTLIRQYNEEEYLFKKSEGDRTIAFLEQRIENVMQNLVDAELKIEEYKKENQITDIEYDIQFYVEQMKELQLKTIELEAQIHVINLLDEYAKDPENKYNLLPSMLSAGEGSGGGESNPIVVYNNALLDRQRILQSSRPDNPLIEQTNNQVDQLRGSVFLSIDNARNSLNLTLADLKRKEALLMEKMGNVPTMEKEFIDIKRQQEITQAVYIILLQKKEEIALSTKQDNNKARIIDAAYVKEKPVGPR